MQELNNGEIMPNNHSPNLNGLVMKKFQELHWEQLLELLTQKLTQQINIISQVTEDFSKLMEKNNLVTTSKEKVHGYLLMMDSQDLH